MTTAEPTPPPPPTIQDRINYAATENNELLKTLSETDYAPAAAQQNSHYITTLTQQIRDKEQQVAALSSKRMKGQSQHEKYQDSTMRRLAYKMSGKKGEFEQKAAKGEREYFEAVQAQFESTRSLEALQKSMREAQQTKLELEGALARHKAASAALDQLYTSIFAGPTPGFPEEDAAEREVGDLKQAYNGAQSKLRNEAQVQHILEDAEQCIDLARRNMIIAQDASRGDIWGSAGLFGDLAERSALARAQVSVHHAELYMQQARRLDSNLAALGPMRIAEQEFMSDMLFDGINSDIAFYRTIKQSSTQIRAAGEKLRDEIQRAKREVSHWQGEVDQQGRELAGAREKLQNVRRGVFDSVAGGLPEYQP